MSTRLRLQRRPRLFLAAAGVYAAVASLSEPLTAVAAVVVAVPCLGVLAAAVVPRPALARGRAAVGVRRAAVRVRRAAVAWALVVALVVGWELAAWLRQPAYNVASDDHPTVSLLLDPVTESGLPRFAAWCCWLYVGYRLVRR